MRRQELLWIEKGKNTGGTALRCDPVIFDKEIPKYVWTLFNETNKNIKPTLPIKPVHHVNAFLEDRIHDWNVRKEKFYYYSRISTGEVWLLLEYEE